MGPSHQLTRSAWVPALRSPARRAAMQAAGLLLAASLGAAGGWLLRPSLAPQPPDTRALAQAAAQLAQARMSLKLSEARSRELEREIDTLHQRLNEVQESLVFFRKAQDQKAPHR